MLSLFFNLSQSLFCGIFAVMVDGQTDFLIVGVIENFLGAPKGARNNETKVQWEFNCPSSKCRKDQNKFNLAYQAHNKVFKCWKCGYSGFVFKLAHDHGSSEDVKRLKLLLPDYAIGHFNIFKKPKVNHDAITCDMPAGYYPLSVKRPTPLFQKAWDYLVNKRKVSLAQIDKLKMGYTEFGPRKFRIIIPSYNTNDVMNYFEARSFLDNASIPYYKPDSPDKEDIIFNEKFINWDLPVYLVEGVFDSLRIPNSIPLLGKSPSPLLIKKLIEHNATVIVCLDEDAFKDGLEIYKKLASIGLNVYFVELKKEKDKKKVKDISKIYEEDGQEGINKVLKTARKVDVSFEINKLINE